MVIWHVIWGKIMWCVSCMYSVQYSNNAFGKSTQIWGHRTENLLIPEGWNSNGQSLHFTLKLSCKLSWSISGNSNETRSWNMHWAENHKKSLKPNFQGHSRLYQEKLVNSTCYGKHKFVYLQLFSCYNSGQCQN